MPRVLLALADVGLGVQLQEALEARRVPVRWDPGAADGPTAAHHGGDLEDIVVVDGDAIGARLPEIVEAWRGVDPAPAVIALGSSDEATRAAQAARCQVLAPSTGADALLFATEAALALRFAGSMTRALARRALELPAAGSPIADAAQIVTKSRGVPIEIARESLRWHARSYVCADDAQIAALRDVRALSIPEVEFVAHLDGTLTVQSLVKRGPIDGPHAARLLWALTSVGAAVITPEPCDVATPRRRALAMIRNHLVGRHERLERGTFYDVLEITPAAEAEDIEEAYEGVARRYLPASLAGHDLADLAALIEPMWQHVEKARAVMHDMAARGRYNDWLRTRWNEVRTRWAIEISAAELAVEAAARGQRALGQGDVHRAVGDFAAAARNHPGHPEYEVNLAWARYRVAAGRNPDDRAEVASRERATAEAVLWGTRPWPRAMVALALLCASDGDPEAARWHLTEALSIDPNLPAAHNLLARLGRR